MTKSELRQATDSALSMRAWFDQGGKFQDIHRYVYATYRDENIRNRLNWATLIFNTPKEDIESLFMEFNPE